MRAKLFCRTNAKCMWAIIVLISAIGSGIACGDEIHTAVQNGDTAKIKEILKKDAKAVNAQMDGMTPVLQAISQSRLDVLELLLTYKPDLKLKDNNGYTPLHWAVVNTGTI